MLPACETDILPFSFVLRREPAALDKLALHAFLPNNTNTRDLKPRNVMLGMDGHIQLADMGGVGDCFGDMSARKVR